MSKPNILIAVPAYPDSVKKECVASLLDLTAALRLAGIAYSVNLPSASDIVFLRNLIASSFYRDKQFTHLLFIDNDMAFTPKPVLRMLKSGKPLVGAAYSRRSLDLPRFHELAKTTELDTAMAKSSSLTIYWERPGKIAVTDGLCQVDGVGTGLMLIAREVIERLIETEKIEKIDPSIGAVEHAIDIIYDLFEPRLPNGKRLTEDHAFCWRWRHFCGGEVWALIDEPIGHIGNFEFKVRAIDAFKV